MGQVAQPSTCLVSSNGGGRPSTGSSVRSGPAGVPGAKFWWQSVSSTEVSVLSGDPKIWGLHQITLECEQDPGGPGHR